MHQSRVPEFLLAACLYLSPAVAATCTRTVTAIAGDTCASLSGSNSLTVTQFIQLNPTISTCSLVPGSTYCVSDDPAAVPTTRPTLAPTSLLPPVPTGTLLPSPDGSDGICGSGYTCLGSVYGDCCSENGYCGNTTEYCATGCNAVFGRCGGGLPVDQPGTSAPVSGVPTTVTVTVGSPVTCSSATRTVTALVTSIVTLSQTVTRLQTVTATVTATVAASAKPSPILDGTTSQCKTYYLWKNTDTCTRIARSLGISTDQLYIWNPALDCGDPPRGYYICIGA